MKRIENISLNKVVSIVAVVFAIVGFIVGMIYGLNVPLPVESSSLWLASGMFYALSGIVISFVALGGVIFIGFIIYFLFGAMYIILN
mgnify:CR=1 FL=1